MPGTPGVPRSPRCPGFAPVERFVARKVGGGSWGRQPPARGAPRGASRPSLERPPLAGGRGPPPPPRAGSRANGASRPPTPACVRPTARTCGRPGAGPPTRLPSLLPQRTQAPGLHCGEAPGGGSGPATSAAATAHWCLETRASSGRAPDDHRPPVPWSALRQAGTRRSQLGDVRAGRRGGLAGPRAAPRGRRGGGASGPLGRTGPRVASTDANGRIQVPGPEGHGSRSHRVLSPSRLPPKWKEGPAGAWWPGREGRGPGQGGGGCRPPREAEGGSWQGKKEAGPCPPGRSSRPAGQQPEPPSHRPRACERGAGGTTARGWGGGGGPLAQG